MKDNSMTSAGAQPSVKHAADQLKRDWEVNTYYKSSEKDISFFWSRNSIFRNLFDQLCLETTCELACGWGKQSAQIVTQCKQLILADILETNLAVCRARFHDKANIAYLQVDGFSLSGIASDSLDSLFCYDSMVSFPYAISASYMVEMSRVLKRSGRALLHMSNYTPTENNLNMSGPHGRVPSRSIDLTELVQTLPLAILQQVPISWGGIKDLDVLLLLERT